MINTTTVKIPKKYQSMIQIVEHDSEGYWAYSQSGFHFEEMGYGCHTAREDTQTEFLKVIRTLKPCECKECSENKK